MAILSLTQSKVCDFFTEKKCQKQPDLNKSSTFVSNEMFHTFSEIITYLTFQALTTHQTKALTGYILVILEIRPF